MFTQEISIPTLETNEQSLKLVGSDPEVVARLKGLLVGHYSRESLWVHSPPLGAKYQPGLAPWVHTFD
jgi:hypothetical protein